MFVCEVLGLILGEGGYGILSVFVCEISGLILGKSGCGISSVFVCEISGLIPGKSLESFSVAADVVFRLCSSARYRVLFWARLDVVFRLCLSARYRVLSRVRVWNLSLSRRMWYFVRVCLRGIGSYPGQGWMW